MTKILNEEEGKRKEQHDVYLRGWRAGASLKATTATEAELARVTIASVFERMHEHLKQDMYRGAMLPEHLLGGGRVRLPTGPLTHLPDAQPTPSDRHVEALRYVLRARDLTQRADTEVRWLVDQGVPIDDIEFVTGHPVQGPHVVPFLQHKPTLSRLVSFPPAGGGYEVDRHTDRVRAIVAPKPPTLREWLGDRVSELGRWADVLREQPVPAGQITGWEWYQPDMLPRRWMLRATERAGAQVFGPADIIDFLTRWEDSEGDCLRESLQMALFTRHPAVKPKPKLRTWFGNEEEP